MGARVLPSDDDAGGGTDGAAVADGVGTTGGASVGGVPSCVTCAGDTTAGGGSDGVASRGGASATDGNATDGTAAAAADGGGRRFKVSAIGRGDDGTGGT